MPRHKGKGSSQKRNRSSRRGTRGSEVASVPMEQLITSTAVNPTPMVMDIPRFQIKPNRTFLMRQTANIGQVTTNNATAVFGAFYFSLATITNAANFTALFDSWRILHVTVRFIPTMIPSGGVVFPPLLTVIDYDDANVPTQISDVREYDTLYETAFGHYLERRFTPAYALGTYSGAFTSFSRGRNWCDVASPSVQWYGIKYAVTAAATAGIAWGIEADIVYQFKCLR